MRCTYTYLKEAEGRITGEKERVLTSDIVDRGTGGSRDAVSMSGKRKAIVAAEDVE